MTLDHMGGQGVLRGMGGGNGWTGGPMGDEGREWVDRGSSGGRGRLRGGGDYDDHWLKEEKPECCSVLKKTTKPYSVLKGNQRQYGGHRGQKGSSPNKISNTFNQTNPDM